MMASRRRRAALVMLALGLGCAILGQYAFVRPGGSVWDGIVWYVAAGGLMAAAMAKAPPWVESTVSRTAPALEPPEVPAARVPQGDGVICRVWLLLRRSRLRAAALIVALTGSVYAAVAAPARLADAPCWDLLAVWAGAVALSVGSLVSWRSLPGRIGAAVVAARRRPGEVVLVAGLALAAFLLRAVNLGTIPYVLSGDEASMGLEAVGVLEGTRTNPFVTGWLSHPTLYFFMQAASLRLFGVTVAALRLPSALVAAPTLVLLYLLVRCCYGRWVAGLSALFLAGYDYAIHYGRIALNNVWDPFFALGALYFGLRGVDERRPGLVALGGAFLGMAWYFYMGARLVPAVLLVALWLRSRGTAGYWRDKAPLLWVMALCALVVALPLLAYFRAAPQLLSARWKLTSMLANDALATEVQRTGRTALSIMGTQFLKAGLAFHHYPDPTFHYRPGVPLLGFAAAILFAFGMVAAARRFRHPAYGMLLAWFALVIIFGGALLENPPSSARLVLAIPPVALGVALGAVEVASLARWALGRSHAEAVAATLVLLLLVTCQSAFFYLVRYTPSHVYGGANTEVAHRMGLYLRGLGPGYYCYFLGAPRMYLGFATIPYLARDLQGSDVLEPLSDPAWLLPAKGEPVFVFLPERAAELEAVRRRYPSGALREFRDASGNVLFTAYEPLE
jgi:4-amino-4-deoxy-L-arabinose transferase-like glycosyltransferase